MTDATPEPTDETPTAPTKIPAGAPRPLPRKLHAEPVQPDVARLQAAGGDPTVWGAELYAFTSSGGELSEESLTSWFATFASQVSQATYRSALFEVANTPLPSSPAGDRAILLLDLRNDLAHALKHAAGL